MPWPPTGATQYHAHLGQNHLIKGLVVFGIRAYGPAKRSGLKLLSTVPCGMNRKVRFEYVVTQQH